MHTRGKTEHTRKQLTVNVHANDEDAELAAGIDVQPRPEDEVQRLVFSFSLNPSGSVVCVGHRAALLREVTRQQLAHLDGALAFVTSGSVAVCRRDGLVVALLQDLHERCLVHLGQMPLDVAQNIDHLGIGLVEHSILRTQYKLRDCLAFRQKSDEVGGYFNNKARLCMLGERLAPVVIGIDHDVTQQSARLQASLQ